MTDTVGACSRAALSPEEVAAYHRDGFLVPDYRLAAPAQQRLVALTSQVVKDNPENVELDQDDVVDPDMIFTC